ncbi:MAG: hypothetical protein IPM24_00605 [Bryobacterales bacterium]|nr:hypothetical protein [Bryobacterales bacterium]
MEALPAPGESDLENGLFIEGGTPGRTHDETTLGAHLPVIVRPIYASYAARSLRANGGSHGGKPHGR